MKQELTIIELYRLLGHTNLGVTELRVSAPIPMVAYSDSEPAFIHLYQDMKHQGLSVQVGMQPRPVCRFDQAPNQWMPVDMISQPDTTDQEIEYVTIGHIEIRTRSSTQSTTVRKSEILHETALAIAKQPELKSYAVIVTMNDSCHVLVPLIPIPVDNPAIVQQYNYFWQSLLSPFSKGLNPNIMITSVFHLNDTMPIIQGYYEHAFTEGDLFKAVELGKDRSHELYHRIVNTVVSRTASNRSTVIPKPRTKRIPKSQENGQLEFWSNQ